MTDKKTTETEAKQPVQLKEEDLEGVPGGARLKGEVVTASKIEVPNIKVTKK